MSKTPEFGGVQNFVSSDTFDIVESPEGQGWNPSEWELYI